MARLKRDERQQSDVLYVLPNNADAAKVFWLAVLPRQVGFGAVIYDHMQEANIESTARMCGVDATADLMYRIRIMEAEVLPSLNEVKK